MREAKGGMREARCEMRRRDAEVKGERVGGGGRRF